MDFISLKHFGESSDESPGPLEEVSSHLQHSLFSHETSSMGLYDSQIDGHIWEDVQSHKDDLLLQGSRSYSVPEETLGIRSDLNGSLFDALLAYEPEPDTKDSISRILHRDRSFGYDVPTTYSSTSMKPANPMDQSQLQAATSCFPQSLLPAGHFLQQPLASSPRKDDFKDKLNANFKESIEHPWFSLAYDQAFPCETQSLQEHERYTPHGQAVLHHASQPAEIWPKRSNAAKSES